MCLYIVIYVNVIYMCLYVFIHFIYAYIAGIFYIYNVYTYYICLYKPLFIFSEYWKKCSVPGQTRHVCTSGVLRSLGRPDFGGMCRARARFSCPGRWFWAVPGPRHHGASRARPPPKRMGGPSKIGPRPSRTPKHAWEVPQKSHLGPKVAQDGPKMAPR